METAAGSERRSTPGPAVPPPPRGHAPLATASGPLSSPAREPPQPEEERQLRISESGQFSDGLEDRGERSPPRAPSPGPAPFLGRAGAMRSRCSGPAFPLAGGAGLGASERAGARSSDFPRKRGELRAAAPPSAAGAARVAAPPPEPENPTASWETPPGPSPSSRPALAPPAPTGKVCWRRVCVIFFPPPLSEPSAPG